jgi:predicted secreted protein
MAFTQGKNATLSVNSQSWTVYVANVTITRNKDTLDVTTLGDSDREFISGLRNATLAITAYFDNTAVGYLNTAFASGSNVSWSLVLGEAGSTITYSQTASGNTGGVINSFEIGAPVDGLLGVSFSIQCSGAITVA